MALNPYFRSVSLCGMADREAETGRDRGAQLFRGLSSGLLWFFTSLKRAMKSELWRLPHVGLCVVLHLAGMLPKTPTLQCAGAQCIVSRCYVTLQQCICLTKSFPSFSYCSVLSCYTEMKLS